MRLERQGAEGRRRWCIEHRGSMLAVWADGIWWMGPPDPVQVMVWSEHEPRIDEIGYFWFARDCLQLPLPSAPGDALCEESASRRGKAAATRRGPS